MCCISSFVRTQENVRTAGARPTASRTAPSVPGRRMAQGLGRTCLSKTLDQESFGYWAVLGEEGHICLCVPLSCSHPLCRFSRAALWIGTTSFMILVLPVVFETEKLQMEQQQQLQQRQVSPASGPFACGADASWWFSPPLGRPAVNVWVEIGIRPTLLGTHMLSSFYRPRLPHQVQGKCDPWARTMPYTSPFLFQILLGPNTGLSGGMPGALPSLPGKI